MKALRVIVLAGLFLLGFVAWWGFSGFVTRPVAEEKTVTTASAADAKLPPSPAKQDQPRPALQDFETRCRVPGVLVCVGFDSPDAVAPAKWPASGLFPAWDHVYRGKFDPVIKASGKGSLRFEIPPHSSANAAGFWRQTFEHNFGAGSTFYVQFRQRFSKEMLSKDFGDTSWKQAIFHNERTTCGEVELTTANYYLVGLPFMYTDCGARSISTNNGVPPYKLQQGDYNCWYDQYNKKDCFFYPADEWTTFYYQVSIGHWGKADSTINAWVALEGRPYKQWIRMANLVLKNDRPGSDYDTVTLLTYMTNKNERIDHPTAYAWYDELIVSTQPIAPPTASSWGSAPPK